MPGYLLCLWDNCDVFPDAQRPIDVEFVFVQLKKEYNKHKERVEHEETEERFVSQFLQLDLCLFL